MTVRLSTTVKNIEKTVSNTENMEIILRFFEFMNVFTLILGTTSDLICYLTKDILFSF